MYGGISESGMGAYHPRVRRDRGIPRGATAAARAAPPDWPWPAGEAPSANGLGKRWIKSLFFCLLYYIYKVP